MDKNTVLALLHAHRPYDVQEAAHRERTRAFVATQARFWQRDNPLGHLTASAWIISADRDRALLTHHRKLDRWFQLGGHIENDTDLLAAATREAREESGLTHIYPLATSIFDIDVHLIPSRGAEAAHYHYDIRFLFGADATEPVQVSGESKALRWVARAEIPALADEASLLRMVAKT